MYETTSTNRCEAISEIISSVAHEQSGLANILNVEAEKIKYFTSVSKDPQEILAANKSVEKMVNAITKLEVILASKLEIFSDCLCTGCEETKGGYSVLSMVVGSENGGRIERDDNLKTFRYYPGTTGTEIKFITEPTCPIIPKTALPSGLVFKENTLVIPNGYNWTQTFNMIFTVGENDTAYEITLLNIM